MVQGHAGVFPQGTIPPAPSLQMPCAVPEIKNKKNNDAKNTRGNFFMFFCLYLCALARTRTRNFWFEAKYDIQFHHEGLIHLNFNSKIEKKQILE